MYVRATCIQRTGKFAAHMHVSSAHNGNTIVCTLSFQFQLWAKQKETEAVAGGRQGGDGAVCGAEASVGLCGILTEAYIPYWVCALPSRHKQKQPKLKKVNSNGICLFQLMDFSQKLPAGVNKNGPQPATTDANNACQPKSISKNITEMKIDCEFRNRFQCPKCDDNSANSNKCNKFSITLTT